MANGYTRVPFTRQEWKQYVDKKGRPPVVHRVACDHCGKRLWGSGLGIGSHNKACPGSPPKEA